MLSPVASRDPGCSAGMRHGGAGFFFEITVLVENFRFDELGNPNNESEPLRVSASGAISIPLEITSEMI